MGEKAKKVKIRRIIWPSIKEQLLPEELRLLDLYGFDIKPSYTVKEISLCLGVPERTFRRWIDSERLRCLSPRDAKKRILIHHLLEFLDQGIWCGD